MRFDDIHHLSGWWFQPTPLKNMTSSVGMMNFPYTMESHESYVLNHQPDKIASPSYIYLFIYHLHSFALNRVVECSNHVQY